MPIADYYKHRERELKRNPDCVAQDLEQARRWALRVAERKLEESSHRSKEKENSG